MLGLAAAFGWQPLDLEAEASGGRQEIARAAVRRSNRVTLVRALERGLAAMKKRPTLRGRELLVGLKSPDLSCQEESLETRRALLDKLDVPAQFIEGVLSLLRKHRATATQ